MLNSLRIQNFKSWQDTGTIEFGAITGFFGTNSSGKTSILQFLLMLKQTVESYERVLFLGDNSSYVNLGTFEDLIFQHKEDNKLYFSIKWSIPKYLYKLDSRYTYHTSEIQKINFKSTIRLYNQKMETENFEYKTDNNSISINHSNSHNLKRPYHFIFDDGKKILTINDDNISQPINFYRFPIEARLYVKNDIIIKEMEFSMDKLFDNIFYLGPLREHPSRIYLWGGDKPDGVGNRGEFSVAALLSSKQQTEDIYQKARTVEQHVAYWLKELGLIHSFEVRPIAPNRKEYEVRIKRTAESAEVFLTDVGFGVSQLLPVLVLLFYVPEGSTIILEQPEIHLHPAVQAGLADVFIDAIKRRNVQIILESHSEHLLQRLQRRLAEEALPTEQVKLYFTDFVGEASTLTPLDLDEYGNIRNWPPNFFGDSFADASAMMDAEIKRRQAKGEI